MKKKRRRLQPDTLWVVGVILLIVLQFWWLPGTPGSASDSFSHNSNGKLGIYRTLSQLFPRVERENARPVPDSACTLLILGPDRLPTHAEQKQLSDFVNGGGTLLFAPSFAEPDVELADLGIHLSGFELFEDFGVPGSSGGGPGNAAPGAAAGADPAAGSNGSAEGPVTADTRESADASNPADTSATANPAASPGSGSSTGTAGGAAPSPGAPSFRSFRNVLCGSPLAAGTLEFLTASRLSRVPHDARVLVSSGGDAMAVAWEQGTGQVILCSTPDFFSNRSLLQREGSHLAVRLAALGAVQRSEYQERGFVNFDETRIVVSEYFNTTDSMKGTGVLFSSPLRTGTLQLILTAALSLWLSFHRFGPAEQDLSQQRRSLTETATAAGNLQYRTGDGGSLIAARLDYLRGQLRRRYGSAVSLENHASLSRISGLQSEEIQQRLTRAKRQSEQSRLPISEAAVTIRWLSQLQLSLLGSIPGRRGRGSGTSG